MSVPSFNPLVHLQHFQDVVKSAVSSNPALRARVHKVASEAMDSAKIWEGKMSGFDYGQVEELRSHTQEVVHSLAQTIIRSGSAEDDPEVRERENRLTRKFDHEVETMHAAHVMSRVLRASGDRMERILADPAGRNSFMLLVEANDPWAMNHFSHLIEGRPEIARELILEMISSEPNDSVHMKTIQRVVDLCQERVPSGKAAEIFNEIILKDQTGAAEFLLDCIVDASLELRPNAISLLFEIMSQFELTERHLGLIDRVVIHGVDPDDLGFEVMQNIMMVFLSELDEKCTAAKLIEQHVLEFSDYTPDMVGFKDNFVFVERLKNFPRNVELKEVYNKRSKKYVPADWEDYSLKLRLCSKLLYVKKDRDLIKFARASFQVVPQESSASTKYFPETKSLMIGLTKKSKYFSTHIAQVLTPRFDVSIYSPACRSEPIAGWPPEVIPLYGDEEATKWLQDPCLTAFDEVEEAQHFLFPRFTHPSDITRSIFSTARDARVRSALSILKPEQAGAFTPAGLSVRGRIATFGEQFVLLDQLMQSRGTLKGMKCTSTFFEGGNALIGRDERGKPYTIVGADVIEMTRRLLLRDMERLGIFKDEKGVQIAGERIDLGEQYLLSDEDVKAFIATDLGLESRAEVFVVEQADYHHDMVMAIMGNFKGKKTVVLNDSIAASEMLPVLLKKEGMVINQKEEEEIEKIKAEAKKQAVYEGIAKEQLERQGFNVIRVPGRFKSLERRKDKRPDTVNFFNFVSMRLKRSDGDRYDQNVVVALGCSPQYQVMFREMFRRASEIPEEHIQFEFLDQKESEELLKGSGGINCMTKVFQAPFSRDT